MFSEKRRYNLEIWALGLGFYLFYTVSAGVCTHFIITVNA